MPKTSNTRKHRAAELRRLATNGPTFGFSTEPLTPEQVRNHYRIWSTSWLLPLIDDLVPELRKPRGDAL